MKAAWKQGIAAVMACADLAHLNPLGAAGRARRAKLFVYGFALAFGACTVYLAVSSSLPASPSPAAAWFGGVFASTSPYRSQISNFFSSIFPTNSSSSSLSPELRANDAVAASGGGQVGSGVGSSNSSTVEYDEQWGSAGGSGVPASNSTGLGAAGAEDGGGAPSSGPASGNVTAALKSSASDSARTNDTAGSVGAVEGSGKDGVESNKATSGGEVPISNQTGSAGEATKDGIGVGSQGSGAPHNNQTVVVSPAATTQNQTRLGVASGGGGGAVNKSAGLAQGYSAQAITSKAGNYSSVLVKGNESPAQEAGNAGDKKADWIMETASCDMFHGRWVLDDSYPLYPEGSCPHIDEPFDCYLNSRPDRAYQKLRWQPNGCSIPRLDPADMLERLRGKRLVFVGDSLNRNMWESLVCILRNSIKDKKKVFEASGRHEFKTDGSYSFLFTDYNCSVEFFRSPFLVQEWEVPISNGKTKETLRLDLVDHSSPKYKDADFIIFNTGHWWTHEKTSLGKDYYQEGSHVYSELNVEDAFRKALTTWAKWIDSNVNPKKTAVFFRGYSASHFSGGQWNSGGSCDKEIEPITNEQYLSSYPPKMSILEDVIHGMKTPAIYLNVTRMTDYRKDAHPSVYRKQNLTEEERRSPERFQDCSHWCLPGVPDSWNELLYAQFLIKQHQMLHQ